MNRLKIILAITPFMFGLSHASSCNQESIRNKSDDGGVLILTDGTVWEVDAVDRVDSALWMTGDDVLVCDDYIINTDENGEKVDVRRLK
jgi:hypothetical protein